MGSEDKTKLDAAAWLSNLGLTTTGTKKELLNKIAKYKRYPKLVEKLRSRTKQNRRFVTSLDPFTIPPVKAKWTFDKIPKLTIENINKYLSTKKEGIAGQQEKAFRMVQSRKIVSVKTLANQNDHYVKASIQKSYGYESRPATILFQNGFPQKGYCPCPVGVSGLCCHIIALLLFIKHYTATGEKILALTCTQQLQKWHKRSRGSIPMKPLNQIKLKSAKMNKNKKLVPSDPDKSKFKRDVPKAIENIQQKIQKSSKPDVTKHFYSILSKSKIGRSSSYGEHICFKFLLNALGDHQYISKESFQEKILGIPIQKQFEIEQKIKQKSGIETVNQSISIHEETNTADKIIVEDIFLQNQLDIVLKTDTIIYAKDKQAEELCTEIDKQLQANSDPLKQSQEYSFFR